MNLNLSMSSGSSFGRGEDEDDNDDQEQAAFEESGMGAEKQDRRSRILDHSQSSLDNQSPYLAQNGRELPDIFKAQANLNKIPILEDKNTGSEQMFSPRSFVDEVHGDRDYSRHLTQMQIQNESQLDNVIGPRRSENLNININDSNDIPQLFSPLHQDESSDPRKDRKQQLQQQQLFSNEFLSRSRDDSKMTLQQSSSGDTQQVPNDYTSASFSRQIQPLAQQQQLANQAQNWDDYVSMKIEDYKTILIFQEKIRFFRPLEYLEYFEDNRNVAQIIIPNVFINPFNQRDLLFCGITKLRSIFKVNENKSIENKTEELEENEDEDDNSLDKEQTNNNNNNNSKQEHHYSRNEGVRITADMNTEEEEDDDDDAYPLDFYFIEGRIYFEGDSVRLWDETKIKQEVFIEIEAYQMLDEKRTAKGKFSLFEFVEHFFPEDNDLKLNQYYDSIQRILGQLTEDPQAEQQSQQYQQISDDQEIQMQQQQSQFSVQQQQISLVEEDFGLEMITQQYGQLLPFTRLGIQFQKNILTHSFKLSKFLYLMGFNTLQKKALFDRIPKQLVIASNNQLKILPKHVKHFRLLDNSLVFLEDSKYLAYLTVHPFPLPQITKNSMKKIPFTMGNLQQGSPILQHQILSPRIVGRKSNRIDLEDLRLDDKEQTPSLNQQLEKGSQNNSAAVNSAEGEDTDFKEVQPRDVNQDIEQIQYIIAAEKIHMLFTIITRISSYQPSPYEVMSQKQIEDQQSLLNNEAEAISEIRSHGQIRSGVIPILSDSVRDKESLLQLSASIIKNPVSASFGSQQFDSQPNKNTKSRPSIMTSLRAQKLTRKLKNAIKSVFNNIRYVNKEERERNYNDGRIIHPHAMTFYNSILRLSLLNRGEHIPIKETPHSQIDDRKRVEIHETWHREEDLKIIDLNGRKDGFRKKLKAEYKIDETGELFAEITFYDPLQYRLERVRVREKKNLEKLQNLLQVKNDQLQGNSLRDILLKMNMKWSKKIIGRKLEFRSFIEMNEDFFNYKLNRKKNPNDEALYKLMTTENYLEESIKQYTNFLYKVKLALISNDQNAETAEQNYFFNTYFYSTRVQQFQTIQNLGRAHIQTTVYQSKLLYTSSNFIFIRIDIAPAQKRTKLIKMILDFNDITTIFTSTEYSQKNCLNPESICKMIKEFAAKVNYSHTQNYNALKIPFWKQFNQISESSDYDLMNQFDFNSMNSKLEISFLSKKSMLTPVLRTLKIIYQGIKKINNQFLLITVKRYLYLNIDWFQLIIYIPKTSRRFVCYMMESDMLKFDPEFMEKVVPLIIVKYESNIAELRQSKNYLQFCEAFDQMHKRLNHHNPLEKPRKSEIRKTIRSEKWSRQGTDNALHAKSFAFIRMEAAGPSALGQSSLPNSSRSIVSLHDFKDQSLNSSFIEQGSPSFTKYGTQGINFVKYFQRNLTDQTSFLEKKVWEHMISTIVIEENKQHKLVLKINTFSGILRETLSSMVLNMNERDNILYEFYIEDMQKKNQHRAFLDSKPMQLEESFNSNLYVRITFFGQDLVHNQKVCGRHMLYSYHKMARSKLKNKKNEITQAQKAQKSSLSSLKKGIHSQTQLGDVNSSSSLTELNLGKVKFARPSIKQDIGSTGYFRVGGKEENNSNKLQIPLFLKDKESSLNLSQNESNDNKKRLSSSSKIQWALQKRNMVTEQTEIADNPFLYSFILADMQEMAIFYANKIKANYNLFVKEREMKQLKGRLQDYLSLYKSKSLIKDSECEPILKPNKSFKRHLNIIQTNPKYFIISRHVLTLSPRQMIAFFYQPSKKLFIMYSWNNINSNYIILKKKLNSIEKNIPHTTYFLAQKLYKDLGDRLFLCYKNQILLETYKHLKDG